jgi:F420-0:gamma-glutamyl ligase
MARKEKQAHIEFDDKKYLRIPLKTHVIMKGDQLKDVVNQYASESIQEGDILFISEKVVAITQGRAFPIKEIKPRPLARLLSNYVTRTPAGIGLGMPETMEMALRECGIPRILFAAACSAITKPFGRKGIFYEVAGYRAQSIDGPTPNTLPPYNQYVVLGPDKPDEVAAEISTAFGCDVAVVDINDIDGVILGISNHKMSREKIKRILKDNPLGQNHEQTPLGIIREVKA